MRAGLSEWSAYEAKITIALELERIYGIEVSDTDIDAVKTPLDFLSLYRGPADEVESNILATLSQMRGVAASPPDLQLDFTELFRVTEHP
jgi:hypothetical protein